VSGLRSLAATVCRGSATCRSCTGTSFIHPLIHTIHPYTRTSVVWSCTGWSSPRTRRSCRLARLRRRLAFDCDRNKTKMLRPRPRPLMQQQGWPMFVLIDVSYITENNSSATTCTLYYLNILVLLPNTKTRTKNIRPRPRPRPV